MKKIKGKNAFWKISTGAALTMFYFAMLAYPFGVTRDGYFVERALIAGLVFFAISIPVWIVNIKREFFSETEVIEREVAVKSEPTCKEMDIGQLAVLNKWLTADEVKQIIYCQELDGMSFEQVAVKRNFLTMMQVKALHQIQTT